MSKSTPHTSGAADLPEALRAPLDSLHADAGYLCGRLLNGSLTQEQVVESIRRRIDAAKLAALTAQAISPPGGFDAGDMASAAAGGYRDGWAAAQAISAEPAVQDVCEWHFDDEYEVVWESSCGELWSFIDGGPKENRVRFCHGCGKPVALAAHEKAKKP